ncbi:hypothetical protein Aph01nite_39670 [Acrocarpospora phusangensis]|uniref:DUF485 domain-containing protein n=1 Tax=Acrocarpospora phusangensis TaxID=1070424 RepID=A0A919QB34_9ACTN|nr:DUF485 domain-containing protein [Acrocarpospora phusangensis]GIH25657.1 hypothetical protein Aph01nite_39670 [Acrocarpospora phusangensis]
MAETPRRAAVPGEFTALAQDDRFRLLRTRFRRLACTLVASFLGWYFLYIALSAFARDFMARPAFGHINMALLLGVLQFVSTFLLAWRYTRYARRMLDPLSAQLRDEAGRRQAEREHIERVMAERRRIENWTRG